MSFKATPLTSSRAGASLQNLLHPASTSLSVPKYGTEKARKTMLFVCIV